LSSDQRKRAAAGDAIEMEHHSTHSLMWNDDEYAMKMLEITTGKKYIFEW
jgi:hypothetical protein